MKQSQKIEQTIRQLESLRDSLADCRTNKTPAKFTLAGHDITLDQLPINILIDDLTTAIQCLKDFQKPQQ